MTYYLKKARNESPLKLINVFSISKFSLLAQLTE